MFLDGKVVLSTYLSFFPYSLAVSTDVRENAGSDFSSAGVCTGEPLLG
jgi:hypothetical protein